ncbi:MAG: metallophosphoesterase family protein [Candidatus Omnitrophica bacterium]|nr:metallophosphoesterase family protein [Candidatus Omnitrophota bacterium]
MKYAIFSDIHGNLEAYQAVLDLLKKEENLKYYCVGDIVGYGADPSACIEITKSLNPTIVGGNHDWAAAGLTSTEYFNPYAQKAVLWTASVLTEEEKDWLRSLRLTYEERDMMLVHGTLMEPASFKYVFDLNTAYSMMSLMKTQVGFIGHSHTPAVFTLDKDKIQYATNPRFEVQEGKRYLVNVGSVGQPRDGDRRAAFCIWDKRAGVMEIRRVEYDIGKAQEKILGAGLPSILAERLGKGR